ncbi:MAG: ATP-dependent zinc metalloprotease FtsH [Clostridia bacterium]|jgi:cell division protease FtsH|nr:ATP-dependent zinc metalloprotease FtsH [Clostridia bacterium]
MKNNFLRNLGMYLVIFLFIIGMILVNKNFSSSTPQTTDYVYSDMISQINGDKVESITLQRDADVSDSGTAVVNLKDGKSYKVTISSVSSFVDTVNPAVEKGLKLTTQAPSKAGNMFSIIATIVSIVVVIALFFFLFQQMQGGGGGGKVMNFGKAKAKMQNPGDKKVTFKDVAGLEEEKAEIEEIVDFLKQPKKFVDLGARIPKGILMVGPPGTGKTLLAKAISGEANVPFFSISGSDFVEMFVGVGASRVRDLFEQAKKNAPCLVFIDEIDAVGRRRGAGLGGGHDEREQTLNQLLVEMDGFGVNQGVIVMAATNRPDILDPALLRPGRFDRQVVVGAPDAKGREEILQVHARGKKLAPDVDLKDIANTTQGFTGADLENLLNEAALHAARKNKKEISMQDVKDSFIRVALGTEKKSHIKTELERKITAYHEAGHAILFEKMPDLSPVHTVSIIPIGMAGGYTMPVPTEKSFRFKRSMEQEIVATFGGRVAEEMIFGDYTQGASKDIEQATNLARNMVTRFGMSEKMGPILYGEEDHEVFLGRDIGHSRNYGENVAGQIDSEIRRIIDEAYNKAKEVLEEDRDGLERTAQLLLKKEKVSGDEFREVLNNETVEEPQETVVIDSEHFNAENSEN